VQTGSTRSNGIEIGITGDLTSAWKIAGGYTYQNSHIRTATIAAPAGAQVAQVPHHTFSLWNRYQIVPRVGVGLGILNRSDMFAAIDDSVVLPGYTRVDAAVFVNLSERISMQANIENVLNSRYYLNADSNTNISPGSPAAGRISLVARF
jgi:catecholate siderophore receptor